MNEQDTEKVAQTFVQILEDTAMMFGEPTSLNKLPPPTGTCVAVNMEFTGSGTGSLELLASEEFATEMATNVLGLEADDPRVTEDVVDAIQELANVTLGRLLTELCGDEAVFDLSPPGSRRGVTSSEWQEFQAQDGTIGIVADDHSILLRLSRESTTTGELR